MPEIPGPTDLDNAFEDMLALLANSEAGAAEASLSLQPENETQRVQIAQLADKPGSIFVTFSELPSPDQPPLWTEEYEVRRDHVYQDGEPVDEGEQIRLLADIKPLLNPNSLGEITDRRQAMLRFIGPAITGLTYEASVCLTNIEGLQADELAGGWFRSPHNFLMLTDAMVGLSRILVTIVPEPKPQPGSPFMDPTDEQDALYAESTYEGRKGSNYIDDLFYSTYHAHSRIVSSMFVPAYLATREGIESSKALLQAINQLTLADVLDIMKESNFGDALVSAAFAPNGTFAEAINENLLSDGDYKLDCERLFEPGAAYVIPISDALVDGVPPGLQPAFSVFDLFVRQDGSIVLNPHYRTSAANGVKYESLIATNYDDLTPTNGCPAARKTFRLRPGDLTRRQLEVFQVSPHFSVNHNGQRLVIKAAQSAIAYLHSRQIAAFEQLLLQWQQTRS